METIKKLQDALTQCHYDLDDTRKRAEDDVGVSSVIEFEPCCEKTGLRGFRPGPTQTGLCSHRR